MLRCVVLVLCVLGASDSFAQCRGMRSYSGCGGMAYGVQSFGCGMSYGSGCGGMSYGSGCGEMFYGSGCGIQSSDGMWDDEIQIVPRRTTPKSQPKSEPLEPLPDMPSISNIIVRVSPNAVVTVNGKQTVQTGPIRRYNTELVPGKRYTFAFQTSDGVSESIILRAGEIRNLNLTPPQEVVAETRSSPVTSISLRR